MDRIDVAAATCEELIQRIPSNGSELEALRPFGDGKSLMMI
jgi:hypothetical protein